MVIEVNPKPGWLDACCSAVTALESIFGKPGNVSWAEMPIWVTGPNRPRMRLPFVLIIWPPNVDDWSHELSVALPVGRPVDDVLDYVDSLQKALRERGLLAAGSRE